MYVVSNNIKTLARTSVAHRYTTQFIFNPTNTYELGFLNPTKKKIEIKLFAIPNNDNEILIDVIKINSFGSVVVNITKDIVNNPYTLSWQSKLPIGRCIVFSGSKYIDVFHS